MVNARLSERSFRSYRRIRSVLGLLLRPLTLVLARDATDVDRFCAHVVAFCEPHTDDTE